MADLASPCSISSTSGSIVLVRTGAAAAAALGQSVGRSDALAAVHAAIKSPSTECLISSKPRTNFVRNLQQLLTRNFATDIPSHVQYYES